MLPTRSQLGGAIFVLGHIALAAFATHAQTLRGPDTNTPAVATAVNTTPHRARPVAVVAVENGNDDSGIPATLRNMSDLGKHVRSAHPRRVLVRFQPGTTQAAKAAAHKAARGQRIVNEYHTVNNLQLVEVPEGEVSAAVARYGRSANVKYAEPDFLVGATNVPSDPEFDQLWGLHNWGQTVNGDPGTAGADIRAVEAWDYWTGDEDFRIAVIDTGINYDHPDLAANVWTNAGEIPGNGIDDDGNGWVDDVHGFDMLNNDGDPMDDNGHGSHVSGTIGAAGDNGQGVGGVNWQCRMVGLKFLGANGIGYVSDAVRAVEYVIENDIKISNNSWGSYYYSQSLRDVIEASQAIGHIFVAAAGNDNANTDQYGQYPSAYDLPNILSVTATDNDDALRATSNYGPTSVDLGAPGGNVYSTVLGGGYGYLSGTSMATPHVTGVAALVMTRYPDMPGQQVRDRILRTVRPVASLSTTTVTGGVVNAFSAIADCNTNGTADDQDILSGASGDCDANGIPDECGPDCNNNDVADGCDIADHTSEDCNVNGIPDECIDKESDCNGNLTPDACDITEGTSQDCTANGIPDECEPDCNRNGSADKCDVNDGTSPDGNGNDVPDECEPAVLYVDEDAEGLDNGTSWADAFTDLQEALSVAAASMGAVEEIWVAEGVYPPAAPDGDRMASFQLANGVGLYGGFAGHETSRDERDPSANLTVLSGDLNGNDVGFDFMDDNSYHVVNGSDTDSTTVLDGFTIQGGNTSSIAPTPHDYGGGMFITQGSPTVVDCVFTRNRANAGGGLVTYMDSHPTLIRCRFIGNMADYTGGGIDVVFQCNPTIRDCVFQRNSAESGGGVHAGIACVPTLANCLFSGNSAQKRGGALRAVGALATLTNCTFSGNIAGEEGEAINNLGADLSLTSCILWGNTPLEISEFVVDSTIVTYSLVAGGWPGDGNTSADPMFVDADGPDDVFGTDDDDMRLLSGSPCVNTGDPTLAAEHGATDLDGNPRLRGCRVDMGAYETDALQPANDFDADGNIDLADYRFFQLCFGAANGDPGWVDACLCVFDVNEGGEVGLDDYAVFKSQFEGPSP